MTCIRPCVATLVVVQQARENKHPAIPERDILSELFNFSLILRSTFSLSALLLDRLPSRNQSHTSLKEDVRRANAFSLAQQAHRHGRRQKRLVGSLLFLGNKRASGARRLEEQKKSRASSDERTDKNAQLGDV